MRGKKIIMFEKLNYIKEAKEEIKEFKSILRDILLELIRIKSYLKIINEK